ncbi:uncharacterized protein PRCAT00002518001 [Priceomyces carsonii]|uniref:uncharacterized protein n=1 Tax=Priceomyces carsonii TaxID=28549 RepID=UPI002EDB4F8A|nr:unnamed protein product [Priceomyces carsonii]
MHWFKLLGFYLFLVIIASECNEIELTLPEKTDIDKDFCKNAGNGNKKLIFLSNMSSKTSILFFYGGSSWKGQTSDMLFVLADENCNPEWVGGRSSEGVPWFIHAPGYDTIQIDSVNGIAVTSDGYPKLEIKYHGNKVESTLKFEVENDFVDIQKAAQIDLGNTPWGDEKSEHHCTFEDGGSAVKAENWD